MWILVAATMQMHHNRCIILINVEGAEVSPRQIQVMLTGHYPFNSSEDPAYRQGSFKFRGSGCSGRAEELLAGLIKRR